MKNYDWSTIQDFYNTGKTYKDVSFHFGVSSAAIGKARLRGDFIPRDKNDRRHKGSTSCQICGDDLPESRVKYCSAKCRTVSDNSDKAVSSNEWRRQAKNKLVEAFGGHCGQCGLVDHPVVFDFHHLVEGEKDFGVISRIKAWAKIVHEVKKCVMLCAPCHRKHHAGVITLRSDLPAFDENKILGGPPRQLKPRS